MADVTMKLALTFAPGFEAALKELAYVAERLKEIFPDATEGQLEQVGDLLLTMFSAHMKVNHVVA